MSAYMPVPDMPADHEPPPKKSIWGKIWSWAVVGTIALFLLGFGESLMSAHALIADGFFVSGILLLLVKFLTSEEAKHDDPKKRRTIIVFFAVVALVLILCACKLTGYMNRPQSATAGTTTLSDKSQPQTTIPMPADGTTTAQPTVPAHGIDPKKYAQTLMDAYRKKHPIASLQEEADAVNSELAKAGLTNRIKLRPMTPSELTSNSTRKEADRAIETLMNNFLREHPDAPHEGSTEEFQYVNLGLEAQGIPIRIGLPSAPCTKNGIKMYLNNSTVMDVKAYGCFTETGISITGEKDDVRGLETAPTKPTPP